VTPGFVSSQRAFASRGADRLKARLSGISMGRPGDPTEIGSVVAFIASDAASYMTGSVVDVHGGLKSTLPAVDVLGGRAGP
jgi:NAD(P)-dependent dehydrogenase (short-subunit alcohol dehydrogenase family)